MDITAFELPEYMTAKQKEIGSLAIMRLILEFSEAVKEAYFDESNELISIPPYNYIAILSSNFLVQMILMSIQDNYAIADRLRDVEAFVQNITEMTLTLWRILETHEASEVIKN